jgi:uncharacterized protein YcbX
MSENRLHCPNLHGMECSDCDHKKCKIWRPQRRCLASCCCQLSEEREREREPRQQLSNSRNTVEQKDICFGQLQRAKSTATYLS